MSKPSLMPRKSMQSAQSIRPSVTRPSGAIQRYKTNQRQEVTRILTRWQTNAIHKLIEFLVGSGYPEHVSAKTFQSPSSKNFQFIFKFLYAQLDPYYEFVKKFEEEVPLLLKGLKHCLLIRYPFADGINKSNLFTVGSLHAWPTLLAMLLWMVELILYVDELNTAVEDTSQLSEAEQAEQMFFEYLTKAYTIWLNHEDDAAIDNSLLENFRQKDAKVSKDIKKVAHDLDTLEKEWTLLTQNESPLTIIERECAILESDKEKFRNYIGHVESKRQKLSETLISLKQEFEASESTVSSLGVEREKLSAIVDAQELSPADVDRMNAERDQLAKNLSTMSTQLDQVNKGVWNKEIAMQKKMDQLERSSEKFNSQLYQLNLLDNSSAEYLCLSKELELNVQQARIETMVSINLRNEAKPALQALIERFKLNVHHTRDESIALQEKMDILGWSVVKKEEDMIALDSTIKTLNEKYVVEKRGIGRELSLQTRDMEGLEQDTMRLEQEMSQMTLIAEERMQKTTKRISDEREELLGQVVKGLSTVFAFEQHIGTNLDELQRLSKEALDSVNLIQ